ncbi:MAG: Ig-like domain-containing protein, partial [Bifidobacteriaceae bacterium]|nr:Ig-like domain-containing protein [Bifidobacteriaceae bacterium]
AAAQMAPVISGTVSNDVNGDGDVTNDPGAPGVIVEIWQKTGENSWNKRGEVITNTAGNYSALLNSAVGEYAVRIKRPVINGINALQTYASAAAFPDGAGKSNTLTAYCTANGSDYVANPAGGVCRGARDDGIDALEAAPDGTGNPFAATGGAQIVSHVNMTTDMAVVDADFGITAAASWGDSKLAQTTTAQGGPNASPTRGTDDYLYLGSSAGIYPDGVNDPEANAHPTDDGLEMAPIVAGETDANRAWTSAQSRLMVAGKQYRFRAKASGDSAAVAASYIKAWISSVNSSGVAATTHDTPLLGSGSGGCVATPDQNGYVYCNYTAGTALPSAGVVPVWARARVSSDSGVTQTSRGSANPGTQAWVQYGEVEDYQLGVAGAVVRVQARTLGNVPAHVKLGLDNISGVAPSRTTDSISTNDASSFVGSNSDHAVSSRTQPVTIRTTSVGAANSTILDGWALSNRTENNQAKDSYCFDTAGVAVPSQVDVDAGTLTIPASSSNQLPTEITCRLTYVPEVDLDNSTVTAAPSDNEANPIVRPDASTVTLDVKGQVRDADGNLVAKAVEGGIVTLALANRAGSGGTPTGAYFQYSTDGGATWENDDQTLDCELDATGDCAWDVRGVAAVAGSYYLTAAIGGGYIKNLAKDEPSDTSPVIIAYRDPRASDGWMTITTTSDQKANHDDPAATAATWGKHTITATLIDSAGKYQDGVAELRAISPLNGGSEGVYYGQVDGANQGIFQCVDSLVDGKCVDGEYFIEVYASIAGAKQIVVKYTPSDGSAPFNLRDANSAVNPADQNRYVTANFVKPPASASDSMIIFTGPGESNPEDTGDPGDDPDGVGVAQLHGHSYSLLIRVWDASQKNPQEGAKVEFRVDPACVGSFANGLKTEAKETSADGRAATTLKSDVVGKCDVHGWVQIDGAWVEVAGGDGVHGWKKTAEWIDRKVDPDKSYYEVQDAEVVANDIETGIVTVTLRGDDDGAVIDAASTLSGSAAAAANLTVDSPFVHKGNGVYEATFHGTLSGDHLISVTTSGTPLAGETGKNTLAHMVHDVVDPPKTVASLFVSTDTALANGEAYVEAWMTVQDKFGNVIAGDTGCSFELPADPGTDTVWFGLKNDRHNPIAKEYVAASGADGRCLVQIRSYYEGSYPVKGMYGSAASPGPDSARPKANFDNVVPCAQCSSWTVAETSGNVGTPPLADGVDSHTVTVTLVSDTDEPAPLQPVKIHWQLKPSGVEQSAEVKTTTAGIATYQIKATVKGHYRVWVTTGDERIPTVKQGSVYERTIEFKQGDVAGHEFTHSTTAKLPLDNVANSHFAQVRLWDSTLNAVEDETVWFTVTSDEGGAHFINGDTGVDLGTQIELKTSAIGAARVLIASPKYEEA